MDPDGALLAWAIFSEWSLGRGGCTPSRLLRRLFELAGLLMPSPSMRVLYSEDSRGLDMLAIGRDEEPGTTNSTPAPVTATFLFFANASISCEDTVVWVPSSAVTDGALLSLEDAAEPDRLPLAALLEISAKGIRLRPLRWSLSFAESSNIFSVTAPPAKAPAATPASTYLDAFCCCTAAVFQAGI